VDGDFNGGTIDSWRAMSIHIDQQGGRKIRMAQRHIPLGSKELRGSGTAGLV
jgi:hypothetical protein